MARETVDWQATPCESKCILHVMAERVWTPTRKWLGNLIPCLFALPALAYAGFRYSQTQYWAELPFLGALVVALILGIVGLNWFGMIGNRDMAESMLKKLIVYGVDRNVPRFFVGAATPKYVGLLDAHEDVGYLLLEPDRVRFVGDTLRVDMAKSTVTSIDLAANVHSFLGLGGWVVVHGLLEGKPIQLKVEPRVHRTMLANKRERRKLLDALKKWKSGP